MGIFEFKGRVFDSSMIENPKLKRVVLDRCRSFLFSYSRYDDSHSDHNDHSDHSDYGDSHTDVGGR